MILLSLGIFKDTLYNILIQVSHSLSWEEIPKDNKSKMPPQDAPPLVGLPYLVFSLSVGKELVHMMRYHPVILSFYVL